MVTKSVKIEYFGDTTKYERATRGMLRMNKKATQTVQNSWKAVGGAIAGVFAFRQSFRFFTESARLAGIQQKSLAGLEQVMRSMGRFSPEFFDSMVKNAEALQKVTLFGDEATISGQKFLLSYREITNDLMPRATKAMLDFAAMMKGDVVGAANALGKASMGMTGELRRIGITIDPIIAKSGDFAAILGEIENQIGGQARALAETGIGPWEQLVNLWGDAREKIGELVLMITKGMIPAIKNWIAGVDILARSLNNLMAGPSPLDITIGKIKKINEEISLLEGMLNKRVSAEGPLALLGSDVTMNTAQRLLVLYKQLAATQAVIAGEKSGLFGGAKTGGGGITVDSVGLGEDAESKLVEAELERIRSAKEKYGVWAQQDTFDRVMADQKIKEEKAAWEADLIAEGFDNLKAQNEDYNEWLMGANKKQADFEVAERKRIENMKITAMQNGASAVANIMDVIFTITGKKSKELFELVKITKIAEAVINTYAAANVALSSVPYPWNLAAAASVVAAGLVNVATIAGTSIGSGSGGGGGGGAVGTFPASPTTGLPTTPAPAAQQQPSFVLNIHGDFFDSMESRQALAEWLTEYVEEFGGDLAASRTF